VQGLTGKKAAGCSGAAEVSGPWSRIDGATLITPALTELTSPFRVIYTGVVQEEDGTELDGSDLVGDWTGTSPAGEALADTCASWVAAASDVDGRAGSALASASGWTSEFSTACSQNRQLLCLEPGPSEEPAAIPWQSSALVLVTSMTGNGNLASWGIGTATGIEAGDAVCQGLAS